MLPGQEALLLQRRKGGSARQSRLVTPTFYGVDTPGTSPRTPECNFTACRARTGPGGADGGLSRPRHIPGVGKGLIGYRSISHN